MTAEAEGQMPIRLASDVEAVRIGKRGRVAVRRCQEDVHETSAWDANARHDDILARVPLGRHLDRAAEPEHLFHGAAHRGRILPESLQFGGVFEQCQHPVADEIDRRFVTGDQQQECHRQQLILAEVISPFLHLRQPAQEIVGWVDSLAADERSQEAEEGETAGNGAE